MGRRLRNARAKGFLRSICRGGKRDEKVLGYVARALTILLFQA
jgi:hypothetical protein